MTGQHRQRHGYAPLTVAHLLARATTRRDDDLVLDYLTATQAAGFACVHCGANYLRSPTPHVAVGRSPIGILVYACEHCPQEGSTPC